MTRQWYCLVIPIGSKTWHLHWPRKGALTCRRSALAAKDPQP